MSAERKKLLWISIFGLIFVLLIVAAGFFLYAPKKGSAQAPATIGNSAPPKAQDPQDYLSAPPASPSLEQPKAQDGNVIVVYGDKPSLPATGASSTAGAASQTESPTTESAAADKGAATADKSEQSGSAEGSVPAASAKKKPSAKSAPTVAATAKSVASKPLAKPSVVRADEYWIQAGSFASRGRADELKQSLAEKGMAALITIKDASGKSLYRVRIGPYASEPEADDWLAKIKGLDGCSAAYVLKAGAKKAK